jgi:hypothetical protein
MIKVSRIFNGKGDKIDRAIKKEELIPFNVWSRERILRGVKFSTSRHKKYLGDGRVFWVSPKMPWGVIKKYFFGLEGADSPQELQGVIEDIYKRPILDDELFYLHIGDFRVKP